MADHDAIRRYVDEVTVEPDPIERARAHALELGAAPVSPAVGAQIAVIAAATAALNIVEIGTGAGVSGLWLLRGSPRATLTTIDKEPEHLAAARAAFVDAKVPPARARFITGRAADVLPRMNEASYDIVLVDADPESVIEYVELVIYAGVSLVLVMGSLALLVDSVKTFLTTLDLGHHGVLADAAVLRDCLRFLDGATVGDKVVSSQNLPYGVA